jgi:hypothetical protein
VEGVFLTRKRLKTKIEKRKGLFWKKAFPCKLKEEN